MTFALTTKSKTKPAASGKRAAKHKPVPNRSVVESLPGVGVGSSIATPTIQTKLKVGEPNDRFEQEADRVADEVMRMPDSIVNPTSSTDGRDDPYQQGHIAYSPFIQRLCSKCAAENEEQLQRKPLSNTPLVSALNGPLKARFELPCQVPSIQRQDMEEDEETIRTKPLSEAQENPADQHSTESVSGLSTGGSPLPQSLRTFYENRFGYDLGQVRIHSGSESKHLSESLHAHAFTYSNHIWLGNGLKTLPSFVMAHELAHVLQQTQPKILNGHIQNGASGFQQPHHNSDNTVQRLPFWVPIDTRAGRIMKGPELHKELLDAVDGKNNVTVEAPVPNAIRGDYGLGLQGFADLYRASSRVGVFFQPRQGLEIGNKHGDNRHTHPAKTSRAGNGAKPMVTKEGAIKDIASGPKDIELGELKPAALTELEKGKTQIKDYYIEGFKDTAKLTNLWASDKKVKDRWSLNPVKRLPEGDVKSPKHDPASPSSVQDRDLALADIKEDSSNGKKETVKYSVKEIFLPKRYLGEQIKGKLFMEPFGQGLWMYYARPNDFSKALDLPKFEKEERQGYMKVAKAVQEEVIGNLTRGPKRIMFFQHGHHSGINIPYIKPSHAPISVSRKPKNSKLKDDFDSKAYERWSKRQSELGDEVRGKVKSGKDTKGTFKKLEFLDLATQAENAITPKASQKTANFPTIAQLKEQIVTGEGKDRVTKDTSLDKLFGWLERWTSPAYKILGQFRLRFGSVFITAVNKFSQIKESIGKKVHEFFKNNPRAKKAGKVLFKALTTALKQVVNIVVPHTLSLIFEAIENGVKKKLTALFEDTFVSTTIEKFKTWGQDIKDYGEKARNYIKKVEEDFLKKFDWVEPLINDIKWFWRIIRAGRALLKCRKPPVLGCLGLLKDPANDNELNCVLCIPWVQKQIGQFVMEVPWFSNIPVKLGNLILGTLKDAVPDNAKILRDIFDEKIPDRKADIEDLVPECDAKCSGFGFFKTGGAGGGDVKQSEVEAAEKMADFAEKLSREQVEDLLKEANRRGMLDEPFDQAKVEEMLKELEEERKEQRPEQGDEQKKAQKQKGSSPESQRQEKRGRRDRKAGKQSEESRPQQQHKGRTDTDKEQKRDTGKPVSHECIWKVSDLSVGAWILEPLDPHEPDGGHNILDQGNSFHPLLFSKKTITRDCVINLEIKNDFSVAFGGDCYRDEKFTKPILTTEISFNGKELFRRTDNNPPFVNGYFAEPTWGSFIPLKPLQESGVLRVKVTMLDPDTGTFRSFDDKIDINIVTKGKCCNCIS
jgi:hypothetical protein